MQETEEQRLKKRMRRKIQPDPFQFGGTVAISTFARSIKCHPDTAKKYAKMACQTLPEFRKAYIVAANPGNPINCYQGWVIRQIQRLMSCLTRHKSSLEVTRVFIHKNKQLFSHEAFRSQVKPIIEG